MKIAILGAGNVALANAWFLANAEHAQLGRSAAMTSGTPEESDCE